MKRTYQPSVVRRKRTHGFLVRMKTRGGRAVIRARNMVFPFGLLLLRGWARRPSLPAKS